jgi:hypothetical protein
MHNNKDNQNLLSLLRNLYGKLAIAIIKIRTSTYRKFSQPRKISSITSVLTKQIDDLAARAARENKYQDEVSESKRNNTYIHSKKDYDEYSLDNIKSVSGIESELSKHLKKRISPSIMNPGVVDKLIASAWEHIHSAIRFARRGEADKAKLHADIAGHALEEVSHYLEDEEYSDFVNQIEQYFSELQKEKRQEV